mmetsp:Transcript_16953/g.54359  ORF Transcript_16953/g.54359 Transcript_16953/m.54359 type:complete len:210 (+) Transcript_16953:1372-2001(+)
MCDCGVNVALEASSRACASRRLVSTAASSCCCAGVREASDSRYCCCSMSSSTSAVYVRSRKSMPRSATIRERSAGGAPGPVAFRMSWLITSCGRATPDASTKPANCTILSGGWHTSPGALARVDVLNLIRRQYSPQPCDETTSCSVSDMACTTLLVSTLAELSGGKNAIRMSKSSIRCVCCGHARDAASPAAAEANTASFSIAYVFDRA